MPAESDGSLVPNVRALELGSSPWHLGTAEVPRAVIAMEDCEVSQQEEFLHVMVILKSEKETPFGCV